MKKLIALALLALAAAMPAAPATAAQGITCNAPLTKHCLGWGRTVFCRCY